MPVVEGKVNKIYLTGRVLQEVGLKPGDGILVGLGSGFFRAEVTQMPGQDPVVAMGEAENPEGEKITWGKVNLFLSPEGILHLGPVVGILLRQIPEQLKEELSFFRTVMAQAREMGVLAFVFALEHLDLSQGISYGFRPVVTEEGVEQWEPILVPLPNVIYNRYCLAGEQEEQEAFHRLLQIAATSQGRLTVYNEYGLDRWDVHRYLERVPKLKGHLPETKFLGKPDWVLEMLENCGSVWLRPVKGREGVCLIQELEGGNYRCLYNLEQLFAVEDKVLKKDSLPEFVAEFTGGCPYLVQEQIKSTAQDDTPVVFQVYLHRDGAGQWQVVALLGQRTSPETMAGARRFGWGISLAGELVQELYPGQEGRVMAELQRVAVDLAVHIDEATDKVLGELELDLVMDGKGNIFQVDVNDCPGCLPLIQLGELAPLAEKLMDYSFFLSKIPRTKGVKADLCSFQVIPAQDQEEQGN